MAPSALVAWVFLTTAQAEPAPAARAARRPARPQTSFDAVLAGKHPAGRQVEFPAVLLPATAIQTSNRGQLRHYVLAVRRDSLYYTGLAETARELREEALPLSQGLVELTRDDEKYAAQVQELEDILGRALGDRVPRLAQVPPAEAIAVEVSGLDGLGAYRWEDVSDLDDAAARFPLPQATGLSMATAVQAGWDEAAVRRGLVNASLQHPPDLQTPLPHFAPSPRLDSEREIESFNAAVELYNAELERRRQFSAQRLEESVRFTLERIERVLGFREEPLSATVIAKPEAAAEAYEKLHDGAPAAYVRERARGEQAFARRAFGSTSLFVTSVPEGALVSLDGAELGPTPLVARELSVGATARLRLSRLGFHDHERELEIAARASGLLRIDVVLEAEGVPAPRPMTDEEGRRLFSADFKPERRFSLAALASSERPAFQGKKDKDGAKRAAAIRKAAALASGAVFAGWFEVSADPDVAEVQVEIALPEPAAASDKHTRVFKVTYRGEQEEVVVSETLSLKDPRAEPGRQLSRIAERLKQRRWRRALGIEG
jgi:hypothetical protein